MYEKVPGAEVFLVGKLSLTRRKKTEICNIRGEYHINRDWSQKNKEIQTLFGRESTYREEIPHEKCKRDIFECIVERMEQGDSEQAAEYDMPEDNKESMPDQYKTVSLEEFVEYSKSMFAYWTEDDFASSFRKMLTIEQFRSEEMQGLYQQYLSSGPAAYVKDLFESMGIAHAEENAVRFYATMYFYYSVYDGADDKEKVKNEFASAIGSMAQEWIKQPKLTQIRKS